LKPPTYVRWARIRKAKTIRAREGAPNVLFFVLDDVGYRQLTAFWWVTAIGSFFHKDAERGAWNARVSVKAYLLRTPNR
jgi:hypothetical protein